MRLRCLVLADVNCGRVNIKKLKNGKLAHNYQTTIQSPYFAFFFIGVRNPPTCAVPSATVTLTPPTRRSTDLRQLFASHVWRYVGTSLPVTSTSKFDIHSLQFNSNLRVHFTVGAVAYILKLHTI